MTAEKTESREGGLLHRLTAGIVRQARAADKEGLLPDRIGSYRVEKLLAKGGMGEVYLAHDDRLGRPVAVKQIRSDKPSSAKDRVRLRREAQAVARLSHPAIAQVHDVVYSEEGDSIVMQYVEGRNLGEIMSTTGLEPSTSMNVAIEVAEGLAAAHAAGLVHRDLKAENIMVTPWGQAKILDFGLVKKVAADVDSITAQGMLVGTISVMSPEQASGAEVDFRSDLFSFGILLYELFTGQSPFWRDRWVETLQAIRNLEPPPVQALRPDLPPELSLLIERLLKKDPKERPQSTLEVVDVLGRIAASGKLASLPKPRGDAQGSRASREDFSISRFFRRSSWKSLGSAEETARALHPASLLRRMSPWKSSFALILGLSLAAAVLWRPFVTERATRVVLVFEPVFLGRSHPELHEQLSATVLTAALDTLPRLEGVVTLDPVEAFGALGSASERALAAGADEYLESEIVCEGTCRITVRRARSANAKVVAAVDEIAVASESLGSLQLATEVSGELRRIFRDRPLRAEAPPGLADPVDHAIYTRLRSRFARGETAGWNHLAALSGILGRAPEFVEGHLLGAALAGKVGEPDRARTFLEAAGALDPEDPRWLALRLDLELEAGDLGRAEETLAELAALVGEGERLMRRRAELLARQGDLTQAVRLGQQLLQTHRSWRNLLLLARHEAELGELTSAEERLHELLTLVPGHRPARQLLAELQGH